MASSVKIGATRSLRELLKGINRNIAKTPVAPNYDLLSRLDPEKQHALTPNKWMRVNSQRNNR